SNASRTTAARASGSSGAPETRAPGRPPPRASGRSCESWPVTRGRGRARALGGDRGGAADLQGRGGVHHALGLRGGALEDDLVDLAAAEVGRAVRGGVGEQVLAGVTGGHHEIG